MKILALLLLVSAESLNISIQKWSKHCSKLVCYGTSVMNNFPKTRVYDDSVYFEENFVNFVDGIKDGSNKAANKEKIFRELGKANLLSQSEEIELGTKIQQLVVMDSLRNDLIMDLRRVPNTNEWAEKCGYTVNQSDRFKEYYMECLQAKHMMVESNMRLVITVAKKYSWMGIPLSDLVQEGSLGLIRAAEKFDPSRGFKFSTYASWWIQQAISKSLAHKSRTIRLPVHVHNILSSVRRARKNLIIELGRMPTNNELAYETGIDPEKLQKYVKASRHALKMDVTPDKLNFLPRDNISEILKTEDVQRPEDSAEFDEFRAELFNIVNDLNENEKKVLSLRFGFEDGLHRSISEVSSAMSAPKSFVKRVLLQSLRKLRSSSNNQKLKEFSKTLAMMESDSESSNW